MGRGPGALRAAAPVVLTVAWVSGLQSRCLVSNPDVRCQEGPERRGQDWEARGAAGSGRRGSPAAKWLRAEDSRRWIRTQELCPRARWQRDQENPHLVRSGSRADTESEKQRPQGKEAGSGDRTAHTLPHRCGDQEPGQSFMISGVTWEVLRLGQNVAASSGTTQSGWAENTEKTLS